MEEPAVAEFEPGSLPPVGMAPAVAGTATAAAATQGEDASASSSSPSKQHEEREAEAGERPPSSPTVEEGTAPDEDGGGASHVPAARGGGGSPGPRPPLQGTLIGPFVVLDPARQSERVNLRAELQKWGVHQRDMEKDEEVQLSLEQAFYLMEECKRLEVTLPEQPQRPLGLLECWRAFAAASPTFVRSVGSYRYFRKQGFVLHGGLNLGLDYMLYRGTPQRYHAEFGVFLRYPPQAFAGQSEDPLSWRDLHLLYRLIGEVRKTLIVAHVRLGSEDAATAPATSTDGGGAHDPPHQAADDHDESTRKEMARWYWGLSVFEVAVTPWRANTPLARPSKARGEEVQHKGRPSSGPGGGANGGGTGEGDGAPPCKRGRVDDGGFGMEGQSSSAEPMG